LHRLQLDTTEEVGVNALRALIDHAADTAIETENQQETVKRLSEAVQRSPKQATPFSRG